jgi:hypothetical protein
MLSSILTVAQPVRRMMIQPRTRISLLCALCVLAGAPATRAADFTLDATVCAQELFGTWDALLDTCTGGFFSIDAGDTLTIGGGATLIAPVPAENRGTVRVGGPQDAGTLIVQDRFDNRGALINHSTIENDGQLDNWNLLLNGPGNATAQILNHDFLINRASAVLSNDATMRNDAGLIRNEGEMVSSGQIHNGGAGTGHYFENSSGGVFTIARAGATDCTDRCSFVNADASAEFRNRFGATVVIDGGELRALKGRLYNEDDAVIDNRGLVRIDYLALFVNDSGGEILNNAGAGMLLRGWKFVNGADALVHNEGGVLIGGLLVNEPQSRLLNEPGALMLVGGNVRNQDLAILSNAGLLLNTGRISNFCDATLRNLAGATLFNLGTVFNWGGTVINNGRFALPAANFICLHQP